MEIVDLIRKQESRTRILNAKQQERYESRNFNKTLLYNVCKINYNNLLKNM
jgi:hypothetical protein